MKKEGKSDSTISRNLSTLRCFFKYLVTKKDYKFKKDNAKTIALLEQGIESLRKKNLLVKKHNKVYIKRKGNAQSQLGHLHIWVKNRQLFRGRWRFKFLLFIFLF